MRQDDHAVGSDSHAAAPAQAIAGLVRSRDVEARRVAKVARIAVPIAVESHVPHASRWQTNLIGRKSANPQVRDHHHVVAGPALTATLVGEDLGVSVDMKNVDPFA